MKFKCDSKELADAIGIVTKALPSKTLAKALEGILMQADRDQVKLTCTDTGIGIETTIPAIVTRGGTALMPGKLLSDVVRKLPNGELTIDVEGTTAVITLGSSRSKMQVLDADGFPTMPVIANPTAAMLPSGMFKRIINATTFAAATDLTRPIITGVLFDLKAGICTAVALDGLRMAVYSEPYTGEATGVKAIIPAVHLNKVASLMDDDLPASLEIGTSHMGITYGATRVNMRLLDGEYLRYEGIIPKDFIATAEIRKDEMLGCLERASIMDEFQSKPTMMLNLKENSITFSCTSNFGESREEAQVIHEGQDLDICFNGRYLVDALRHIDATDIQMKFTSGWGSCLITPRANDMTKHMVLPVRTATQG